MPTSSEPTATDVPKPAIEIRGLGKRNALGEEHASTQLREAISSVGRDPIRALRSLLPGGRERPLLAGDDPRTRVDELLVARAHAYERFAQIDTSDSTPAEVADSIVELVRTPPPPDGR